MEPAIKSRDANLIALSVNDKRSLTVRAYVRRVRLLRDDIARQPALPRDKSRHNRLTEREGSVDLRKKKWRGEEAGVGRERKKKEKKQEV